MSKRFRVAFSFAGEKRNFVAKVARLIAERFDEKRVLYDEFHVAEFARPDLAFYLPDLYHREADLVVAVLCRNYQSKDWCGLEWSALYGLIKKRQQEHVMLARFDQAEGVGLYENAGYVDLDDLTPQQAAKYILERLACNEGHPKDHYTRQGDLSNVSPDPRKLATAQTVADRRLEIGNAASRFRVAEVSSFGLTLASIAVGPLLLAMLPSHLAARVFVGLSLSTAVLAACTAWTLITRRRLDKRLATLTLAEGVNAAAIIAENSARSGLFVQRIIVALTAVVGAGASMIVMWVVSPPVSLRQNSQQLTLDAGASTEADYRFPVAGFGTQHQNAGSAGRIEDGGANNCACLAGDPLCSCLP